MRIYIERCGRPYNYLKSVKYLNDEREKHLLQEEEHANHLIKNNDQGDTLKKEAEQAALDKLF